MATSVEAMSKRMSNTSNAMVSFLLKGPLRLSGFGDPGGDTTAGPGEDGDAEAADVVSAEACKGAGVGVGAASTKADAALSERLPSSPGADGDIAGLPCPLLSDGEDCGEDWAWVAT